MEKEDIVLGDWRRLLIGDNPWGFALEVLGRTLVIYVFLIIVMRLLGKRMSAQLTILDLAVMLTLGAIASVPMQAYDRGVLPGIILLISILILHQSSTQIMYKNRKMEVLTQGKATLMIKDGVLDPGRLHAMRISQAQLFSVLRIKGIRHLGQVKRLYSEADGNFSLYKPAEAKPGLSVFPGTEKDLPPEETKRNDLLACNYCGNIIENQQGNPGACNNCKNKGWIPAVQ